MAPKCREWIAASFSQNERFLRTVIRTVSLDLFGLPNDLSWPSSRVDSCKIRRWVPKGRMNWSAGASGHEPASAALSGPRSAGLVRLAQLGVRLTTWDVTGAVLTKGACRSST